MNCYLCELELQGSLRYGIQLSVGVCQGCGIGVCLDHSRKAARPGSPLLCPQWAAFKRAITTATPDPASLLKKESSDVTP